jgi:rfaE bifunctional protein kinase chain/domain
MSTASEKRHLHAITRRFGRCRIVVVGDWMVDRYLWGNASRISPEAAVPVVDYVEESDCLGGAGNVAANIAALGASVDAFGVAGDDQAAQSLQSCLRFLKLAPKGILTDSARPTTLKTRVVARHQQIVRIDRESRTPLSPEIEAQLGRQIVAAVKESDAVVLSDYDKGVLTDALTEQVLSACARHKIPTLVKPKWSRLPTYRGARIVICNRAEASFLVTRSLESDADIEDAGRALLAHFGCAAVIITRGERGLTVVEESSSRALNIAATSHDQAFLGQATRNTKRAKASSAANAAGSAASAHGREVFDVTGAGDTVLACCTLAIASGAAVSDAALLGNLAAGVVVGKLGTATLTPRELRSAIDEMA